MNKPSEKAMQLARQIGNWLDVKLTEPQGLWALAQKVDTHTAEAISPYKKALDEAERALEESHALNQNWVSVAEPDMLLHLSEYKATMKIGEAALATIQAIKEEKTEQ